MSSELVQHLRDFKKWIKLPNGLLVYTGWEAAARIEMLEAALKKIAKQAVALNAVRPGKRIREKKDD